MAFIGRRGLSLCPWGKQTDLWVRGRTGGSCALDSAPAWPVAGSGPAQSSLRSGLCPLVPASQGCAPQRLPCSWRRKAPADMCPHRRVPDTQGSDRVEKRGALCGMRGLSLDLKLCKADPQEGRDSCGGGSQALPAACPVPDGPPLSAPQRCRRAVLRAQAPCSAPCCGLGGGPSPRAQRPSRPVSVAALPGRDNGCCTTVGFLQIPSTNACLCNVHSSFL